MKKETKMQGLNQLQNAWEYKPLYGRYAQIIKNSDINTVKNIRWLKSAVLKAETEEFNNSCTGLESTRKKLSAKHYKKRIKLNM